MTRERPNLGPARSALRRQDRGLLLLLLERALAELPPARVRRLLRGFVPEEALAAAGAEPELLDEVRGFVDASLRREFYEDPSTASRKTSEKSRGTEAFIAEMDRLEHRCIVASRRGPQASTLASLELLLDLVRRVDADPDGILFCADEGGAWQLGMDWDRFLPAYFRCLASESTPEEFVERVNRAIDDFVHFARPRFIAAAFRVARPDQKAALRSAIEASGSG